MRRQYLGIALLIASAFTGTLAFRLATPAVAFYTRDILKASMAYLSIISASFILARSFSALFSGLLLEKRKSLVYLGALAMVGNALAVNLYPFTSSWLHVMGIKLMNGFLNGIAWPIAQFVIAVSSPKEIRSRVTALYFIFGNFAGLLGNYTYAITQGFGLKGQMYLASFFFFLTALCMLLSYWLLYEKIVPKREKEGKEGKAPINPKKILMLSALISFLSAFTSGEITYIYVAETLNLDKGTAATLIGLIGFIATLLAYIPSRFADLGSERKVIITISVLAGVSPILAAVKNPITVFLGILMAIFAAQTFRPISRSILASARRASAAIGGINAVRNLSTTAGQLVFGFAYSLGEIAILGIVLKAALLIFAPASLLLFGIAIKLNDKK
ncbi:MFS transporter [Thermococcus sp. M39]|uniref:MFS transporter n=1 Tax=unclassified Thermococcus TaxID=2627626 RepID=UPI001439C291|nr:MULTISPECIES: MFS transporter [unclassified Thermococcus]NJE07157.1 MFS transporter [Thermococcus sp. M39]NJE12711.1 MFS transporter [Thermococcus sp. LS2]